MVARGDPRSPGPEHVESARAPARAPSASELERAAAATRSRAARVAVAVLNGGMATRFGGDVKGIIEAVGGRTFLEMKLAQARGFGRVPFLIMNSFATHARTLEFLAAHGLGERAAGLPAERQPAPDTER